MRIIFAGTPEIAQTVLRKLLDTEHEIIAVYTQPDRPAGRGRQLRPSPVKELALENNLIIKQPINFKDSQSQAELAEFNADLMIVVAYGLILPENILNTPEFGCINVHVSLLPKWRGAAPIQRALLAGDTQTGVSVMQMDAGLDTGDILAQSRCDILQADTSESLHDKLAILGAECLIHTLDNLKTITPIKQNNDLASYAKKITKEEAKISWHEPANIIERKIRGYYPWPVAYTELDGQKIRVWQAGVSTQTNNTDYQPGEIISANKTSIDVFTAQGILNIKKMQLPGGKCLAVQDILNAKQAMFSLGKTFS